MDELEQSMIENEAPFVFDDYSVGASSTPITIEFGGRLVPFTIKRGLNIHERQKATEKSVKRHVDMKTSQMVLDGIDDAAFSVEVCALALVEWPFTDARGKKTPINRETIGVLDPALLDKLSVAIMTIRDNLLKDQQAVIIPFAKR